MRVSKFLVWLIAALAALSFAITPVIADEHPWSEDENPGGSGDGGEPDNGGVTPDDPNVLNPESSEDLLGSPLYWWELLWDDLTGEDTIDGVTSDSSPGSENTSDPGGELY